MSAAFDVGWVKANPHEISPGKVGVDSKVMGPFRFGFAAGCEAVAMPRCKRAFCVLGSALGAAFGPINPKG